MGKKSRMGVLKRQREAKKAEKAQIKRDKRNVREEAEVMSTDEMVADRNDLEGYGILPDEEA